jgi:hypothetical protein
MTVNEFLRGLKHHLTCIQNAVDRLVESQAKENNRKPLDVSKTEVVLDDTYSTLSEVIEGYPGGLYGYIHDRGAVKTVVDAAYRMGGPTGKISEWNLENPITREFAERAFSYARTLPVKLDDLPKEFL